MKVRAPGSPRTCLRRYNEVMAPRTIESFARSSPPSRSCRRERLKPDYGGRGLRPPNQIKKRPEPEQSTRLAAPFLVQRMGSTSYENYVCVRRDCLAKPTFGTGRSGDAPSYQ